MKSFISVLILLLSVKTFAVDIQKAKDFMKKKTPCNFAFSASTNGQVPNFVYCVWNGIANQGTINEQEGCFLGQYNMANDTYLPLAKYGIALMASSQPQGKCTKQVVEDILVKYPMKERSSFGGGAMPFLVEFKKNSNSLEVLYDSFNVYTDELNQKVSSWKNSSDKKSAKKKKVNCDSDSLDEKDDILHCRTADQLISAFCGVNLGNEQACLYLEAYKNKTGKMTINCTGDMTIKNFCK